VIFHRTSAYALVDSGNTWRLVISAKFAKTIGIKDEDIVPFSRKIHVKTASDNGSLQVKGQTRTPLLMRLPKPRSVGDQDRGDFASFKVKPVVIENLGMDVNISGPFLKHHRIDQLHSEDCLRLANGVKVPLQSTMTAKDFEAEGVGLNAVTTQNLRVKPRSMQYLKVRVPRLPKGQSCEGIVEGSPALAYRYGIMPWSAALVKTDEQGVFTVGFINPTDFEVKIKSGTVYGNFALTCRLEEQDSYPWRVAIVDPEELEDDIPQISAAAPNKPTVREKLAKIVDQMKEDRKKEESEKEPVPETLEQKREWLKKHFRINSAEKLKGDSKGQEKLIQLLLNYWDILSVSGEFGKTHLLEHEIDTGDARPIRCKDRVVNPVLAQDLKKQLDKNLAQDVIEPSSSPWSFPLVAAPKKNGKVRWCIDYRRLNDVTVKDRHPLPSITDNLSRLSDAKIFSTLDGSGAFHVIPIKKGDRKKTAFSTPFGLFQYKRMPFGLCNGPASYSRLVQLVLQDIPLSTALPYLDDIIILSRTVDEHFANLEKIFKVHRKAGLKLQPEKCHLFASQVEYLGHLVSAEGVSTVPAYVERVQEWQVPKTVTDFRSFLGVVGYYRRFIKGFSALAAPLIDAMTTFLNKDDDAGYESDDEAEQGVIPTTPAIKNAFEKLKQKLLTAPILAYPRFYDPAPFILDTDYSQGCNAIGGVLSQVQDGKERVIAYGGKKLSKAQRKYDPFKGELAALLYFVKHWKYYLQYRPFLLRVDHAPLTSLKTMEPKDRHTLRMLSVLADFDFKIVYRKGKSHGNADGMSRAPHLRDAEDADEDVATDEEDQKLLSQIVAELSEDDHQEASQMYSKDVMVVLQDHDPVLKVVKDAVEKKEKPDYIGGVELPPGIRHYLVLFDQLFISRDGLLRYQPPSSGEPKKPLVCLPSETWDKIINEVHSTGGHCGINNTVERLTRSFYFPRMKAEVEEVLKECLSCRQKGQRLKDQRHTLVSVQEGYPFQKICVDYVGPLHEVRGKSFIFTCRDSFTRWTEAVAVPTATAANAVNFLVNEVIKRFGVPEIIHSDCGSHFTARMLRYTARTLGIKATTTPAYNPKSNRVERWHQDLGNMARAIGQSTGQDWVSCLPAAVMASNTQVHSGTGYSPYRLLFGRDPPLPLDLLFKPPDEELPFSEATTPAQYAKEVRERVQEAFSYARENLKTAVTRRRQSYLKAKQGYVPGDNVWLLTPVSKPNIARKLQDHWSGPWLVVQKHSDVLYEIKAPEHWKIMKHQQVVSVDRLAPYPRNSQQEIEASGDVDLSLPGDEFLERPEGPIDAPEFLPALDSDSGPPPDSDSDDSGAEDAEETARTGRTGPPASSTRSPPLRSPQTPFRTPMSQARSADPTQPSKAPPTRRSHGNLQQRRLFSTPERPEFEDNEEVELTSGPLPPIRQEEEAEGAAGQSSQYSQDVTRSMTLRDASQRKSTRRSDFQYY
jgi:hypothetical protein